MSSTGPSSGENHNLLKVLSEKPFNAEPEVTSLIQHPLTPSELVYCRNHSDVHEFNDDFIITIDGLVMKKMELSVRDLKARFTPKTVVAALQCAGNRRQTMVDKTQKDVEGIKWGEGTICNIKWTGIPLRDLLLFTGIPKDKKKGLHVCFASHIACEDDDYYGGSIPLENVLDKEGDIMLAYNMNDQPLTPGHGYPLRAVAPGYSGMRWVKWVDHITVTSQESQNFYQQKDYKVLPSTVTTLKQADAENWWSKVPPLQVNALNSVIGSIKINPIANHKGRDLFVAGYALSGLCQIERVEVSINKGQTWLPARITYQEGRWSWTLWEAHVKLPGAEEDKECTTRKVTVWSRATDHSGIQQISECDWNLRGVAYCAVGERTLEL